LREANASTVHEPVVLVERREAHGPASSQVRGQLLGVHGAFEANAIAEPQLRSQFVKDPCLVAVPDHHDACSRASGLATALSSRSSRFNG